MKRKHLMGMVSNCEHLGHPSLFLSNPHLQASNLTSLCWFMINYHWQWSQWYTVSATSSYFFLFTQRILALLCNSLEVSTTEKRFFFSFTQCKYAKDFISLVQLENTGPDDTPAEIKVKYTSNINIKYSKDDGNLLSNPTVYRQLIGSLVYLTCFRPYISHVVNIVCQIRTTRHFHMFPVQRINHLSS